ncbi:MAG TPA: hypothetical protein VHN18_11530 [Micromonosporaceae bacterium]|nr:hypothetical protein [Micromonosporaceae bacterium]
MSVPSADDERRSRQPLTILFWLGAGLALVAALILLAVPGNTGLRMGAVLGLLAVVLIGLSITLRGRADSRPDLAESVLARIDGVRQEFRTDVGAATQATHRLVGERLRALQAEVEAVRADFGGHPGAAARPLAGTVRGTYAIASTAAYPEDMSEPEFAGAQQAANGHFGVPSAPQPGPARPSSGRASVPSPAGRHPVATGVVRHTETVHVTTRQTIVEPDADRQNNVSGSVYAAGGTGWTAPRQRSRGSAQPDRDWSPADAQPDLADDGHEPEPVGTRPERERATGRRPKAGRARARYESDAAAGAGEPAGQPRAAERASRSWRAEDRWASVRDDAEGREVRVGQRRAAVRADDTGTDMRVEDRWVAVQQAHAPGERSAGGGDAGERWADNGDASERWADARGGHDWSASGRVWPTRVSEAEWVDRDLGARWEDRSRADQPALGDNGGGAWADRPSTGRVWRPRVPAALPAGGSAASSREGSAQPEREPVWRAARAADDREAYGFPPSDGSPRAGGRQVGFERSDSRWG